MATASYNSRPRPRNIYKDGKKRSIFVRTLMWIFPHKGDGLFEAMRKIIFLGALVCFIYFGGGLIIDVGNDFFQQWKIDVKIKDFFSGEMNISDEEREKVLKEKPEILSEYIPWYNQNPDLIGHIMIPDITSGLPDSDPKKYVINYPVYQTYDNKYYLTHAYDHTYNKGGSIFADYRNKFADGGLSGNTVLYGHNISTGNYFAKISRYYISFEYRDINFYKTHPIIKFNTIYERSDWKIFACVLFNTEDKYGEVYRYNFPEFKDEDDFNTFILDVMDRSVLFTDVDLTYGDHILTLSTCYYPYGNEATRVAIFARKVREGESSFVDVSKAAHNTGYKPFELQKQRIGNTWYGRVWDTSYLLNYNSED
ncbi:MAG: class B sortase [Oscillospiraceae bacterium]|nr:class B sortase [Oscillospiraceae bacterium]